MTKFFKSVNENELSNTLNDFEQKFKITDKQYSTCFYDPKYSKVWHCVMVTYENK